VEDPVLVGLFAGTVGLVLGTLGALAAVNDGRDARQCRKLLSFVDGRLPPLERPALRVHLARCIRCQSALEALADFDQRAARLDLLTAGGGKPA
jgi:hypothetical protein